MEKFAKPGEFCLNEACPDYGKLQESQQQNFKNLVKPAKGCNVIVFKPAGRRSLKRMGRYFIVSAPQRMKFWKRWPCWPKAT